MSFPESETFDPIAYLNAPRRQQVKLGLERIATLLSGLGNPQDACRFVHVAGTNGKGSTCAFLSSVLQRAGYRTGLFTSPYLYEFQERIQVDGVPISLDALREETLRVRCVANRMKEQPTEFELMTAVAFLYFAHCGCDVVVCEVGLGGRFDSTNVISNVEVSLITPISLDHCVVLGNTYAEIAREKAGIIKDRVTVISAPQYAAAEQVIAAVAHAHHAPLRLVRREDIHGSVHDFAYRGFACGELGLKGSYQTENAALALEAVSVLRNQGWDIPDTAVVQGMRRAYWPGRFEVVEEHPLVIFDGAHNTEGMRALIASLQMTYPEHSVVFVLGVLADKQYEFMAQYVAKYPAAKAFVCNTVSNPRALPAQELAACLRQYTKRPVVEAHSCEQALAEGLRLAAENSIVCVCGSLYQLGDMKSALLVAQREGMRYTGL